jgi:hypothetical protein
MCVRESLIATPMTLARVKSVRINLLERERVMKTIEEIKYEINFIENELVNRDFTYLTIEELNNWLVSLQWTLKGESQ